MIYDLRIGQIVGGDLVGQNGGIVILFGSFRLNCEQQCPFFATFAHPICEDLRMRGFGDLRMRVQLWWAPTI